ncbi:MAG: 30S ribosomal protein S13 [Candidatus Anstonellales archaeon]
MAKEEKESKQEKKQSKHEKKGKNEEKQEQKLEKRLKGIVRIAGNDLDGGLKLHRALLNIKGISHGLRWPVANIISNALNVPKDIELNKLNEEQVEKINKILYSIDDRLLPAFLLNRRKDMATGNNIHVIMNDLDFAKRQDIEAKKKSRTWQGYRHLKGQKVRGQRTKNTGRTGMTVGVIKKKEQPAKAEGKQGK